VSEQRSAAAGKLNADLMGPPCVKGDQYQCCAVLGVQYAVGEGSFLYTASHSVSHKGFIAQFVVKQQITVCALGFCRNPRGYTEIFLSQLFLLNGCGKSSGRAG